MRLNQNCQAIERLPHIERGIRHKDLYNGIFLKIVHQRLPNYVILEPAGKRQMSLKCLINTSLWGFSWANSSKEVGQNFFGFKSFHSAEATIAGIELHRMLKKANI